MGLFNIFDKVGTKQKTDKFTAMTTGIISGVSAIQVNKMHLPLVDYEVNGEIYQIRMAYDIAKRMEKESMADDKIVRANLNYGSNYRGQITKLQGVQVKVMYDPDNPRDAVVLE